MGIILKIKISSVEVIPFGLRVNFESYEYKKLLEWKKIIIALAGPVTNFLIAIIAYYYNFNSEMKSTIIYTNILLGVFNLIPIYPLDGGRILKSIFRLNYKPLKADEIINKFSNIQISILTAIFSILIIYFKNIGILLVLGYLWMILIKENKKYSQKLKVYDIIKKYNNI